MLSNFVKSTLLSLIIIDILLLSITISDQSISDCNLCKTLLPRTIDGRNYIVTHVPALIPYNFAKTFHHDPYVSTITSKLIPVTIKSSKHSKHDKFMNHNVHNDNGENLPTLIYQHDVQMHRTIPDFFQALPKMKQYLSFSHENDHLDFGDPQQSPLTIDYKLNADNVDFDKISDYNVALMGYGNNDDNQQVPRFNATTLNAYNPPINNVQKMQLDAHTTPSFYSKIPNQASIHFHDYPIKYGGVIYHIKPGKAPKLPVNNENAYSAPLDSVPYNDNVSKLSQILFGIPFDNLYSSQPDQMSQIQINADDIPNDSFKTQTQFNDYYMNDYNIPFDMAYPVNADTTSHNDTPDKQSKITINAYNSGIPPAHTLNINKDGNRVPENDDDTPFNNDYSPVVPQLPIIFNANPINAYNGDKSDKQTINADVISQNNKPDKTTFAVNNDYNLLLYTEKMDKRPNPDPENADNTPSSDQPGKLSTIQFDSLFPQSPFSLNISELLPITLNSYPVDAYNKSENAHTTPYNNKPEKSPIIQVNNDNSPLIPPSPHTPQVNKQSPISFNAHPVNAYNGPVVIPNVDESNKQTINTYDLKIPSIQNLDRQSLTQLPINADGKTSNDQLTMQFNTHVVNADDLPQPVLNNVNPSDEVNNDFNQRKAVLVNNADDNADINGQITLSNGKIPDDESIYPPPDVDDDGSSISRISNLNYEDNVSSVNADDDNTNADNSAKINDEERFYSDVNDWFDSLGSVTIDQDVLNSALGLTEALTHAQPMNENDRITTSNLFNQHLPTNHENAHIKVDKVYNITQKIKFTEEVTNDEENNADDSLIDKINTGSDAKVTVTQYADGNNGKTTVTRYADGNNAKTTFTYYANGNNAKTTVTQYDDGNNVASVKPTQPIPESALMQHAGEKRTIIQQIPQKNHTFMLISKLFTKNHNNINKTPILLEMMKNDQQYQTRKTTNYQPLKELGLLTLHLFKYLNANEKMSNDQIVQYTITDVINGKTDDIINDPEILAYVGSKLLDLKNDNLNDSKMLTTLKMILMKILNNSNFNELKSFFDKNQNPQTMTRERVTHQKNQKKCACKSEPVAVP